jgi:hypothetical protein
MEKQSIPDQMVKPLVTFNDYKIVLKKWLEDPLQNKFCFIIDDFQDLILLISISDVVSFYLNIRLDGTFFVSLPEEEDLILDEFEDVGHTC